MYLSRTLQRHSRSGHLHFLINLGKYFVGHVSNFLPVLQNIVIGGELGGYGESDDVFIMKCCRNTM